MTIDQYETVAAQPESLVTSLTVPSGYGCQYQFLNSRIKSLVANDIQDIRSAD